MQFLKKLTHELKPVVRIGQHGLTEPLLAELDIALTHHELIKIKIAAADRDDRKTMLSSLLSTSGAALVQQIGSTAVLYRQNKKKPVLDLPK